MKIAKLTLTFLLIIVASSCKNKETNHVSTTKTDYGIIELRKQETLLESDFPVTIKGQEDVEIRPRVEGFIENIYIDEGSMVRKGQTLFKISCPQAEQTFRTTKAAISRAKAKIKTAEINVNRLQRLSDKDIIGDVQLQTANNDYETALAELEEAEAAFENAKANIDWTNVTSPVDGVVGSVNYRKGSLVNSSNTLTIISNTGKVYAYFSFNENKLTEFLKSVPGNTQSEKIANTPELTLVLSNGEVYSQKGKIETITGHIDISTGSAILRAAFNNPQGILKSGTSGNIVIPQKIESTLVIPQKATFQQQNKTLVYKIENDTIKHTVINTIPLSDGTNYAVVNGLKEGDKIATSNLLGLKNGSVIKQ